MFARLKLIIEHQIRSGVVYKILSNFQQQQRQHTIATSQMLLILYNFVKAKWNDSNQLHRPHKIRRRVPITPIFGI